MSLLGGALIVLLRAAGEQEGKGASSVSPATRPRGRHNFCGQQESTSPEGGFLVNLSQQMAPFSGGRITGESPPARLLHAGGRVGSVGNCGHFELDAAVDPPAVRGDGYDSYYERLFEDWQQAVFEPFQPPREILANHSRALTVCFQSSIPPQAWPRRVPWRRPAGHW